MDAKASAKSKRAHSLHGNRKRNTPSNPSQSPSNFDKNQNREKNPSESTSSSAKNQSKEKNRRSHPTPLPSNWDRYHEDGFESDRDDPSIAVDRTGRPSADIVVPKSKGADFKELISQARTDERARSKSHLENFASFDDVLPDLNEGASAILSVRGKSLLSLCGDDNFIVDDNASSSYEASFLSMDLHALAAQLEKINISERLFIEEDLLPAELCVDVSKESSSQGSDLAPLELHRGCVGDKNNLNNMNKVIPSKDASITSSQAGGFDTSQEAAESTSFPTFSQQGLKPDSFNEGGFLEPMAQPNLDSAAELKEKNSRFRAVAAAEAELDMLLDSLSETKLVDSGSMDKNKPPNGCYPIAERDYPSLLKEPSTSTCTQPLMGVPSTTGHVSTLLTLDDAIDDLLGETSIINPKNEQLAQPERVVTVSHLPHSSSHSSSKALGDFDSWMDSL